MDGMSLMQKFLQDELFRSLKLPKLVGKEWSQVSDDDLDLANYQAAYEQKVLVEELKHHEAVLLTVPAFPVPTLQSERQPDGPINYQKPAGACKRLVTETYIPILIRYLDGSHSMESTVNEFIGHLERTRPQDKKGKIQSISKRYFFI